MDNLALLALVDSLIERKFEEHSDKNTFKGPRGPRGLKGRPGKDGGTRICAFPGKNAVNKEWKHEGSCEKDIGFFSD